MTAIGNSLWNICHIHFRKTGIFTGSTQRIGNTLCAGNLCCDSRDIEISRAGVAVFCLDLLALWQQRQDVLSLITAGSDSYLLGMYLLILYREFDLEQIGEGIFKAAPFEIRLWNFFGRSVFIYVIDLLDFGPISAGLYVARQNRIGLAAVVLAAVL